MYVPYSNIPKLSDFVLEKETLASYVVVNEVDTVVDIDNNTNPEGTKKDEEENGTKQEKNERDN